MSASQVAMAARGDAGALPVVGDLVAGRYLVTKVLGAGGVGAVFAADDARTGSRVALKLLLPKLAFDGEIRARFLREAQATARIRNDHVVRVLDVGATAVGAPFLVMEFLEGRDLDVLRSERGPLPSQEAVALLLQACSGLAAAHVLGIVHRDVKCANLFVTRRPDGAPLLKVVDFGIAKAVGGLGGVDGKSLTNTAASFGTPTHMAPEQVRSSKNVDARADVWAIGVVAYELLSGRLPFDGPSVGGVLAAVIADAPAPLPASVAPGLGAVVRRCLEKDPDRRYPSMAALAAALAPFAAPGAAADALASMTDTGAALGPTILAVGPTTSRGRSTVAVAALGLLLGASAVFAVRAHSGSAVAAAVASPELATSAAPASTAAPALAASGAAAASAVAAAPPPHDEPPSVAASAAASASPSPSASAAASNHPAPRGRRSPDPTADRE